MRAWHSMPRYGARYPLVAAYCMLHVLALTISHVLARCNGARWRADLCVFFSSCPRPIGKNSYKCLTKTCRARLDLLLLFRFHTPCHTAVRRVRRPPRRARGRPGSRHAADPGRTRGHGPSDRRGWHAGSVNPIAVPGRHYRNAHPPASSRTRTGSRLLLPYRFTTIQISRRRDAPQPQKCPASAVGSRPPMPCGTATPWAGGSRTRVRSSGRWCRRGEGKGTV
jgi:hypothetical protein